MTEELSIDIQGFIGPCNQFLPKEIAVVSVNHPYSDSWVIGPPCRFADLSPSARRQNNWLTRYHHRLTWEDGDIPLANVPLLLLKATTNAAAVYVRGREKALYLSEFLSTPVINLEEISPSFRRLSGDRHLCLFHGIITCELYNCALQNAYKIKAWLLKEKEDKSINTNLLFTNKISGSDIRRLRGIVDTDLSSDEDNEGVSVSNIRRLRGIVDTDLSSDEDNEGVDEVDINEDSLTPEQLNVLHNASDVAETLL